MSKIESAIRVAIQFNEAFNRHDVAGMMRLVSGDCAFESFNPAPDGATCSGKEEITQFWDDFFRHSPQAQVEIEDIFGFGERCIMRWRYSWEGRGGEKGHLLGKWHDLRQFC